MKTGHDHLFVSVLILVLILATVLISLLLPVVAGGRDLFQ